MHPDSIEAMERAALAGDWGAAARLGLSYLTGNRVPADPVRGIALIQVGETLEATATINDVFGGRLGASLVGKVDGSTVVTGVARLVQVAD